MRKFLVFNRIPLAILLLALGFYIGFAVTWWIAWIFLLVGLLMIAAHYLIGPMSLIQKFVEEGDMDGAKALLDKVKKPEWLYKPVRSSYYMLQANFSTMSDNLDQAETDLKKSINAGITEQSMMSMAAGLASRGYRPFVYSIANFPTFRCLEQIRNDVCYMNNSVVIVSVGAGFAYGTLGYSHFATEDLAIMRTLPNLEVVSPCDKFESEAVTRMIVKGKSPTYLRLGKAGEPNLHTKVPEAKFGKFLTLYEGDSGYIFFTGSVGAVAVSARNRLIEAGRSVSVVSVPFVSQIDDHGPYQKPKSHVHHIQGNHVFQVRPHINNDLLLIVGLCLEKQKSR